MATLNVAPTGALALMIILFLLFLKHETASSQFVFKVDEFQNVALPAFEKTFLTFASDALQNESVTDLFVRNLHRGSGRRRRPAGVARGQGPSEMSRQSLKQMMEQLKVKVDRKYSDAVRALTLLKEEFERNMNSSLSPRSRQLVPCCSPGPRGSPSSPLLLPGYRYEGRYRDFVNVTQECVGKRADAAQTPFTLQAEDAFRLMKVSFHP